eukprot:6210842-Pleurochrysis_carterae.AAC.1
MFEDEKVRLDGSASLVARHNLAIGNEIPVCKLCRVLNVLLAMREASRGVQLPSPWRGAFIHALASEDQQAVACAELGE